MYSYGALFGPQLFGHGTRVESHKSFGKVENKSYGGITRYGVRLYIISFYMVYFFSFFIFRNNLESTIKSYNHYYEVHGGSGGVKSREVNGRLVLEGVLRLYWGVHSAIQLKEDDDQRLPTNLELKAQKRAGSSGIDCQVCVLEYLKLVCTT